MKRDKFRAILNYIYEIQKILYETKKCKQEHCKSCNYANICKATSNLLTIITREVDIQDKGKSENDTK